MTGAMPNTCTKCGRTEPTLGRCESCDPLSIAPEPYLDTGTVEDEPPHWQNWAVSRVVTGLVIALGMEYAVGQYVKVFQSLCADPFASEFDETIPFLAVGQALWVLGVLFATIIIGAGKRQAWILGGTVGMLNGAILILWEDYTASHCPDWLIWSRPLIHALVGAIGGSLGASYWQPLPVVGIRTQTKIASRPTFSWNFLAGPVRLGPVFAGVFIVVTGVVWSKAIFEYLIRESRHNMPLASHFQSEMVIWEISVLATLLGAGFAGANTYNGLKHGMCVAAGATCIFLGIQLNGPMTNFDDIVLKMGSIIFFSMLGGWFGSKVVPPLVPARRRKAIYED